jgi:hypothetical protein
MPLFSKFRTCPKVQNRSKRHFAKFLPFAGLCDFAPHLPVGNEKFRTRFDPALNAQVARISLETTVG